MSVPDSQETSPGALNDSENKYGITELETLAVVWGISHLHHFLYGHNVTVYTDHAAVKAVLEADNPTAKHARWWTKVYGRGLKCVKILYRAGKENSNADALSQSLWELQRMKYRWQPLRQIQCTIRPPEVVYSQPGKRRDLLQGHLRQRTTSQKRKSTCPPHLDKDCWGRPLPHRSRNCHSTHKKRIASIRQCHP